MKIEKLREEDIIEGGLYRLLEGEGKTLRTWCRHNLLKAVKTHKGGLRFVDTYWNGSSDTGVYSFEEVVGRLVYLFDLTYARSVSKREWMEYREKDRTYIPIGGSRESWLIDTRAEKDKVCIISMLEEDIAHLKSTIEFNQRELRAKEKALGGLMEDAGKQKRTGKEKMKIEDELPAVTQEAILDIDGTPNKEYPLRILRAHRENCNCKWVTDGSDPLLDTMNDQCDERAKILDDAIKVLEQHNVGVWDAADYD